MSTLTSSLSEKVSRQKKAISFSGMNANQVKSQLAAQLDDKEKVLERIGTSQISRNALIKQSDDIKKEILSLNKFKQDEVLPLEIKSKLEGLANEFQYLKTSKAMLDESAATFSPLLPPPPTNSSPSKQRSKPLNGNRRNPDIEFATEIGQGLLIEVRKLQSALQEKEEIIKHFEFSKADTERTHETTQRQLKQKEEIEERLKEENWNLEVANQELRSHLSESNQSVAKHNADYARLTKQLKSQAEQMDIMKAQEEKAASVMEAMKARHEQETHHLRRHAASAQRDNSQIQKQVDALNTELKIVKAKLAIKLATSSRGLNEEINQGESAVEVNDDNESDDQNKTTTPPTSSPGTRSQHVMETETLKQSLAHAHRIISNLRSSYHKEKLEKFEIKKMLSDSQENIEQLRKEMSSWNSNNTIPLGNIGSRTKSNGKKKTAAKKKRGGVARQPRGLCPNESDTESKLNQDDDEEEEVDTEEYDSMDDDTLDQNFTNYGNSFGGILDFNNGSSFSSIPMKPLSSELEYKVEVVNAGINTDPIDFSAWAKEEENTPESPSSLLVGSLAAAVISDSNTRSDSGVAQNVPQNQEVSSGGTLVNQPNAGHVSPIDTDLINQQYVQDQVTKALTKERECIAQRAGAILSPEQIETLLTPTEDQSLTVFVDPLSEKIMVPQKQVDQLTQSVLEEETAETVPKSEVDKLIQDAIIVEQKKIVSMNLIPKADVDKLIHEAVESEQEKVVSLNLIPKADVDKLVQEAVVVEQRKIVSLNLIPKADVNKLIEEAVAIEKEKVVSLNLIPRVDVDKLIEEAVVVEQEKMISMISKADVDKLIQEALEVEKEKIVSLNLISKTEADKMVEETVEQLTKQLKVEADVLLQKTRQELDAQYKSNKQELLRDMIPKAEAEAMSLAAVTLASEKAKQEVEATSLQNIPSTSEEMITKKEAEKLIQLATTNEQVKVQQALEKQKIVIEAAALEVHKKELEKQKLELDSIKKNKLDKHIAELELIKQTELEKQKQEIEAAKQAELEKQKQEIELIKQAELDEQKKEIELIKQADLEKQKKEIEQIKKAELEEQKKEFELTKKAELEKQKVEMESIKQAELEQQKAEIELAKQTELETQKKEMEKQKLEIEAASRAEFQQKLIILESAKQSELEQQKNEAHVAKLAELAILAKSIDAYKKEAEETNQRMVTMLTKDSADVLVKRAIADALEKAEKNQSEVMAGMISREYAMVMIKDEVSKALDLERKEVAQREEEESIEMISKAEAEALAKVAAADAIVKERQAMAAREKELVTKEEAEILAAAAAREAVDKEREESSLVLARERKMLREKEERLISKEEADQKVKEAVRIALVEKESKYVPELTTTSQLNIASNGSSRFMDEASNKQEDLPSPTPERSVSTSRLAPPSLNISPAPSISTPASTSSRKLRLSNSVSSLRLGSSKKENSTQKNPRPSTDSATPSMSFGSFRILENSKYGTRLQSKSSISLRELSNRQESVASISTMSSDDAHHGQNRVPLPMNSEDSFPGFSNGGTDVHVISSVTQTMIGEWMSKHTRRYVGGGISENKHQRYFWIHPYTRILYWSSIRPGAEGNEAKTKSAFVESVSAVPSHDSNGASPMSLLIRTPKRDLKLTATSIERHDLWLKSLSYLLCRPNEGNEQLIEEPRLTTESNGHENAGHQQTTLSSKASERSIPHARDVVNYDSDDSDDLVNIRQCCDGKHDLSTLSKGSHHHHHHS